jgi:hypothetical protein
LEVPWEQPSEPKTLLHHQLLELGPELELEQYLGSALGAEPQLVLCLLLLLVQAMILIVIA